MKPLVVVNSITRRDQKSLDKYFVEISKYKVLTPAEELALFKRYKTGDETALTMIIQHNLRFVVSVAKQYENRGLSLGDLINEGNLGILTAAHKFDETRGFKFISYAVWWIRQSIIASIATNGRKIRLPANYNNISVHIRKFQARFSQEEGREPNLSELMLGTGFTKNSIEEHFRVYPKCKHLDAPFQAEESASLMDSITDLSLEQPDHELMTTESLKQEIKDLLLILAPREASVIVLSFGLESKFPMSLEDIGKHLNLSAERVRQLRDKSLRKLRRQAKTRLFS